MSRRRTGAIAIGVGAATAVVLSLVGAKTPVVIGSAAVLGIAGGVVAGRRGTGKRVSKTKQLVGEELLAKVNELGDISKSDLVRACGYVSTKNNGEECLDFTSFYEALLNAKDGALSSTEPQSKAESLAQGEQSISQSEKETLLDLPITRYAFSISIEIITREFKCKSELQMTEATYRCLCNIEDYFDPEIYLDFEEDSEDEVWQSLISTKDEMTDIDSLKEWIEFELNNNADEDDLSHYWEIGNDESSTYSDKESFLSAVDWDIVVNVVKTAWQHCRSEKEKDKIIRRKKEIDSIDTVSSLETPSKDSDAYKGVEDIKPDNSSFLSEALDESIAKQDLLQLVSPKGTFYLNLNGEGKYGGLIQFFDDNNTLKCEADLLALATFSGGNNTWLWSWLNTDSFPYFVPTTNNLSKSIAPIAAAMVIRKKGAESGFDEFNSNGEFHVDWNDRNKLVCLSLKLLNADAFYRTTNDGNSFYGLLSYRDQEKKQLLDQYLSMLTRLRKNFKLFSSEKPTLLKLNSRELANQFWGADFTDNPQILTRELSHNALLLSLFCYRSSSNEEDLNFKAILNHLIYSPLLSNSTQTELLLSLASKEYVDQFSYFFEQCWAQHQSWQDYSPDTFTSLFYGSRKRQTLMDLAFSMNSLICREIDDWRRRKCTNDYLSKILEWATGISTLSTEKGKSRYINAEKNKSIKSSENDQYILTERCKVSPLMGDELLAKVKELGDVSKSDLVRLCGYVSTKKDGGERINFTRFYEELLAAKAEQLGLQKPVKSGDPFILKDGTKIEAGAINYCQLAESQKEEGALWWEVIVKGGEDWWKFDDFEEAKDAYNQLVEDGEQVALMKPDKDWSEENQSYETLFSNYE